MMQSFVLGLRIETSAYYSLRKWDHLQQITSSWGVKLAISRLTVVSREAKKKQHTCASSGQCDHYSELFTRMAALNF